MASMVTVMAAVMAVMVGESSASEINARPAVIVARSTVIVAGACFIAHPDPAMTGPFSPTYQSHLLGQFGRNRCAQSAGYGPRICPRADERSCACDCRHSCSCKNQTTHFFLLLVRNSHLAATISRAVSPICGVLHPCFTSNCRSALMIKRPGNRGARPTVR